VSICFYQYSDILEIVSQLAYAILMYRLLLFVGLLFCASPLFSQSIDPLIDTPGKTIGSDFNGDGIHDFIVGAELNNDGGGNDEGAAYVFFGSTTLSGTFDMGGGVQSADVTIFGKGSTDKLGRGVASVGDVNGDGFDDIIVGARQNNDGGTDDEGAAYIFFGSTTLSGTKDLGGVQSADVTFLGKAANDYFGNSTSAAGDVNGDGFDDILVGAQRNGDGANLGGAAYIFFGSATLSGTKSLGKGQSADVTILAKGADDRLGRAVSGAGDVNGDGFDDIIVGAYTNNDGGSNDEGVAYIIFGASNLSGTKDTATADEDVRFLGKATTDRLGRSLSGAGDVNGDGFDDVIMGAEQNDDGGSDDEGAAYIFFGANNLSGTKDTGSADEDVRILGKGALDRLGSSVSGAGDVNGDGFNDFIVGAQRNNDGGTNNEGAAYIFFGSSTLSGTKALGGGESADITILGKAETDYLGGAVAGIGDVNGDGFGDIIVAARKNDDGGTNDEGAVYIFFGSATFSGTLDMGGGQSADVTILGKGAGDILGIAIGGGRSNPGP